MLQISLKSNRGLFQAAFPCYVPVIVPVLFLNKSGIIQPDPNYNYLTTIRDGIAYVPIFTEYLHAARHIINAELAGVALVMTLLLPSDVRELFQSRRDQRKGPYNLLFDQSTNHEGWQVLLSDFPSSDFDPDASL